MTRDHCCKAADGCSPEELAEIARKGPEAPGGESCLGPGCRQASLHRGQLGPVLSLLASQSVGGVERHRVIEQHRCHRNVSPGCRGGAALSPQRGQTRGGNANGVLGGGSARNPALIPETTKTQTSESSGHRPESHLVAEKVVWRVGLGEPEEWAPLPPDATWGPPKPGGFPACGSQLGATCRQRLKPGNTSEPGPFPQPRWEESSLGRGEEGVAGAPRSALCRRRRCRVVRAHPSLCGPRRSVAELSLLFPPSFKNVQPVPARLTGQRNQASAG